MGKLILNWLRAGRAPITDPAYIQGYEAFSGRLVPNPHAPGSFERMCWRRGWAEAKAAWAQAW